MVKRGIRGQVTLFIILGVIILIAAMTFYIINNKIRQGFGLREDLRQVSDAPAEVLPAVSMIEDCITSTAKDGLRKLGQRGGYIYPERWGFSADPIYPYEGSAVRRFPASPLEVPYWYFMEGNTCPGGRCNFLIGLPLLYRTDGSANDNSIEAQLDSYVNENLRGCLFDLEPIRGMGFKVDELGDIRTTTSVTGQEVIFEVNWPLSLEKAGSGNEHLIDTYNVFIPLKLQEIYKHALTIAAQEIDRNAIEWFVLGIIIPYTGLGDSTIPPFSAVDFSVKGSQYWMKYLVQDDIKTLLHTYIPLLQYYNSSNYVNRHSDDVFENYYYNLSMNLPSAPGAHDFEVTFDSLEDWDAYVDLNCNGMACRGDSVTLFGIIPMGIQKYRFFYNISFPVLVSLYDPEGMDEGGYLFQYFLESNIRYNKPAADNLSIPVPVRDLNDTSTMFCNFDQRTTGVINLTTVAKTRKGDQNLSDVRILYSCAGESCEIGSTDRKGLLDERFPVCYDGVVYPYKEGYLGGTAYLSTFFNESDKVRIRLDRIVKINVTMKKLLLTLDVHDDKYEWRLKNLNPVSLDDDDFAIIRFTRQKEFPEERDHTSVGILYGNDSDGIEMEIAPGKYLIEADIFSNRPFVIPEDERTYGDSLWDDGETVEIPKIELNESVPLGMIKVYETVTADEAYGSDELALTAVTPNFYALEEHERVVEVLEVMGEYEKMSSRYYDQIKPRWKDNG